MCSAIQSHWKVSISQSFTTYPQKSNNCSLDLWNAIAFWAKYRHVCVMQPGFCVVTFIQRALSFLCNNEPILSTIGQDARSFSYELTAAITSPKGLETGLPWTLCDLHTSCNITLLAGNSSKKAAYVAQMASTQTKPLLLKPSYRTLRVKIIEPQLIARNHNTSKHPKCQPIFS